jgi:hypothetical protein
MMYLPELPEKQSNTAKHNKNQSMRLLIKGQEDTKNSEYLDKQQLETDLYKGLKKDIDSILLKAWDGLAELSEDELRRFREVMRYKQGQQLFIHLLNQFRVKRLFQINNQTAMFSLGELLAIVLDENYDSVDTSIPVNCHVLASTFYINVQEPKKQMQQHYLFELI